MRLTGFFAVAVSLGLVACAHSSSQASIEPRRLLTSDALRTAVMGKIATFPRGAAATAFECYIFAEDGQTLACSNGKVGQLYSEGTFAVLEDRICSGGESPSCWQFLTNEAGETFIRHLAFQPRYVEERVCLSDWTGTKEPCQVAD